MEYKYNFLLQYAIMESKGISRSYIRKQLSRDMGVIPATLRRWEKFELDDADNSLPKSQIMYCCTYFNCSVNDFVNQPNATPINVPNRVGNKYAQTV